MITPEHKRTTLIAYGLSLLLLAWVPLNIYLAFDSWQHGHLAMSGLASTVALMSAWGSRSFVRFHLLQLALWFVKKELSRMYGATLQGFQWTTPETHGKRPEDSKDE